MVLVGYLCLGHSLIFRCDSELRSIGYRADELLNRNFVRNTFGFGLGSVRNVIITWVYQIWLGYADHIILIALPRSGQFDPLSVPGSSFSSDPSRHFYIFPSIGLSARARELNLPNSCDPVALRQARTQVGISTYLHSNEKWYIVKDTKKIL